MIDSVEIYKNEMTVSVNLEVNTSLLYPAYSEDLTVAVWCFETSYSHKIVWAYSMIDGDA